MTTSSTTRVIGTFTDVEDATAYLLIEGGGSVDVSLSGTWAGTVLLEMRTPPAGTARTRSTHTVNTEEVITFAGNTQVRLRFSIDTSGTVIASLTTRKGKQR